MFGYWNNNFKRGCSNAMITIIIFLEKGCVQIIRLITALPDLRPPYLTVTMGKKSGCTLLVAMSGMKWWKHFIRLYQSVPSKRRQKSVRGSRIGLLNL